MYGATNWHGTTFPTYWSKHFKTFIVEAGDRTRFRVSESFRPFSNWRAFRQHVTQVRTVSSDYTSLLFDHVLIYEFFMPLTNEGHLRNSLDALFYKDRIVARLRPVDQDRLRRYFPPDEGEKPETYMSRVVAWVSERFGGYSIQHVSGRFRAEDLASAREVAEITQKGGRYLIDETTAVVRFIFPCGEPRKKAPPLSSAYFEEEIEEDYAAAEDEASRIRWFFNTLFAQSVVQIVNGEDEIRMLESGMRNRLHIWRVEERE